MSDAQRSDREPAWYVQTADRVWGPYSQARIEAFVAEGRVSSETLLGQSEQGPFVPARRLSGLFEPDEPVAEAPAPQPASQPAPGAGPARVLMIWAGLRSQRPERFEAALGGYGPFVRIGADLWVLRARLGPSALRNALTRRLEAADTLMVVEASLEQAAWFNIHGEADHNLRQLWVGAERS